MEIRVFRQEDKASLLTLLRMTFEGWHSESYWDWLYQNNPQGESSIGVALEDGEIVASYSVCPVPMVFGGTSLPIGLGVDAATHPKYRRRGLFENVAKAAFANAEQRGFHYILGYSEWDRPAALGQVAKLGFRRVFMVKRLVKVLDWPRILAFKTKFPVHPPTIEHLMLRVKTRLNEGENLSLSILSRDDVNRRIITAAFNDSILVNKSPEYLQWRYFDNPEKHYLLFASDSSSRSPAFSALTLRREKRIVAGVIVDIFGNRKEWVTLLKGIESLMRHSGVPLLEAYASQGHRAIPLLTSMAYRNRSFSLAGILRSTANATSDGKQFTSRAEAWQTTLSDDPSL